jgi:hypothetical protein
LSGSKQPCCNAAQGPEKRAERAEHCTQVGVVILYNASGTDPKWYCGSCADVAVTQHGAFERYK